LGEDNAAYCKWISNPAKWGGAIELSILATHYGREIAAYDIQTKRCDVYGQVRWSTGWVVGWWLGGWLAAWLAGARGSRDAWAQKSPAIVLLFLPPSQGNGYTERAMVIYDGLREYLDWMGRRSVSAGRLAPWDK
jgi:hypothetical protein